MWHLMPTATPSSAAIAAAAQKIKPAVFTDG
jgi:hypothetical protein